MFLTEKKKAITGEFNFRSFIKGMLKNDEGDHQASFVSKFYQEVQNNKANNLENSFTGNYHYFAF